MFYDYLQVRISDTLETGSVAKLWESNRRDGLIGVAQRVLGWVACSDIGCSAISNLDWEVSQGWQPNFRAPGLGREIKHMEAWAGQDI